jgi:AraC family transcriptional regulator
MIGLMDSALESSCGRVLRSKSLPGFSLIEKSYPPYFELPRHSHECAYFCSVLKGGYTESYGKRWRTTRPSTVVFHPPEDEHADTFHEAGVRCFNILVASESTDRLCKYSSLLAAPKEFDGGAVSHIAARLYQEFRHGDQHSPLIAEGLVLELLGEASRLWVRGEDRREPLWLKEAVHLLHTGFLEPISLSRIAEAVEIHPVHLAREFRRRNGCTLGEYVVKLRIDYACQRFSEPSTSLAEIALAAGFSSQSHFSRAFKRLTGMTPAEYRKVYSLR